MRLSITLALLAFGGAAQAAEPRDYCPERPGLNTPPCIVDRGHVSVETGLVDWTRQSDPDARTDTILFGDTLARLGLTDRIEAQLGWTPFGIERDKDRTTGAVSREHRIGDVTLGLKAALMNPDGDKVSIALLPSVTLPTGRAPIGAGDWAAGLRVPMSFGIGDKLALIATPEVDAAVDEDGDGRHLAYGSAAGVQLDVTEAVSLSAEGMVLRDRDPDGHQTTALASLSVAWKPGQALQLDAGAVAGLNHASPDAEVYIGISRRF